MTAIVLGVLLLAGPVTRFLEQPPAERAAFVEAPGRLPLVEGERVLFLASGATPPRLVGDFNDWGDSAPSGHGHGEMQPLEGAPGWFTYETRLAEDARVEYALQAGETRAPDPRNPEAVDSFGGKVSVVRMPRHAWPPELDEARDAPRGRVETRDIAGHRVHVYLPPGTKDGARLPAVYFQDGTMYLEAGVPRILDRLLAAGRIPPLIAVLVDPAPRRVDYKRHPPFRRFYVEELLPAVDGAFPTDPRREARTLVGSSRGALAAADLAIAHPDRFGKVGLFSPALRGVPHDTAPSLIDEVPAGTGQRWAILTSRYDQPWREDGRLLHAALKARGHDVTWREHPDSHSLHAWRARIGELLELLAAPRPQ
jgi:enterochelin esterase-like enzyme